MNETTKRVGALLPQRPEAKWAQPLRPSQYSVPDASGCWCDGFGFRWRGRGEPEADLDKRILGGNVYCPCPTGEAALQGELDERKHMYESRILERRERVWRTSGIPLRFSGGDSPEDGVKLDTSPLVKTAPDLVARLRRPIKKFTDDDGDFECADELPESWLLWGDYGCGKTGLAVSYARQYVWPDGVELYDGYTSTVIFRSLPDMLTELRATYSRRRDDEPTEMEVLEKYRGCDLLIIDDLGAEQVKESGWLEDRLYQIIGQRHGDEKSIVFTSNLSPEKLGERLGERNMWRVIEMCGADHIIHVTGPNIRIQPR